MRLDCGLETREVHGETGSTPSFPSCACMHPVFSLLVVNLALATVVAAASSSHLLAAALQRSSWREHLRETERICARRSERHWMNAVWLDVIASVATCNSIAFCCQGKLRSTSSRSASCVCVSRMCAAGAQSSLVKVSGNECMSSVDWQHFSQAKL